MKKTRILITIYSFSFLLLLLTLVSFIGREKGESPPNILLIVSEDHSPHLSCYGDTIINTPNLDKIASEGVLFNNAYVTQSVCSPSRSSIFSGLFPHQSGHLGLASHGFHYVGDVKNIYQIVKEAGYRTGMIGKLHVNPESDFPIDYHPLKSANFAKLGLDRYAKYAGDFFTQSSDPFFLMVNYPDAHGPWQDTVENRPRSSKIVTSDEVAVFPYIGFENERIRKITANYYNSIQRLDECIGELMQTLLNSAKDENTLVIYLSDHGDQMTRGKYNVNEAGTKVPFIVKWPGKTQPGVKSDALVSTVDIVPTILNAIGKEEETPRSITGKSLLPLLMQPELSLREYLYVEQNADHKLAYFPRRAVRNERYKLIYTLLNDRKNRVAEYYMIDWPLEYGSPTLEELQSAPEYIKEMYNSWIDPPKIQLYDLQKDPWEFYDLADDPEYNEIKETLFSKLKSWQEETDDPLRFPEKLKALTTEIDTIETSSRRNTWHYPKYLYGYESH